MTKKEKNKKRMYLHCECVVPIITELLYNKS